MPKPLGHASHFLIGRRDSNPRVSAPSRQDCDSGLIHSRAFGLLRCVQPLHYCLSAPDEIRTHNPLFKRQVLYAIKLRGRFPWQPSINYRIHGLSLRTNRFCLPRSRRQRNRFRNPTCRLRVHSCGKRDLNPHGISHTPLKRACLPIPAFPHKIS